ncbi:NADH-ubiquinone oxidoreductase B18 subunit-domain-containing protein, partial [Entophlyctis helioformis]
YITQAELNKTQIPLAWRDYCAHLLPELNKCRRDSMFMPWKCEEERVTWMKCQYDDYQRRMRKLERRKAARELALADAAADV